MPFAYTYQIGLKAVRTANDDGSQSAIITSDQIQVLVEHTNNIYEQFGIQFLFDKTKDVVTINNTLLNQDFLVLEDTTSFKSVDHMPPINREINHDARTKFASIFSGKIVVFFKYGTKLSYDEAAGHWKVGPEGSSDSSWARLYVEMNRKNPDDLDILAHEVGHYLQNRHTFGVAPTTVSEAEVIIKKYVENEGHSINEGLNALDGDRSWVTDTPADTKAAIFNNAGLNECGPDGIPIPVNFTDGSFHLYHLRPDTSNIMSYYMHCAGTKTFTPQQIERLYNGLEDGLRHRLISLKAKSLKFNIIRKQSLPGESISQVKAVFVKEGRIATAVRHGKGKIRIIIWDIGILGGVTRRGSSLEDEIEEVQDFDICNLGLGLLATAVSDDNGNLKVILWKVTEEGQVVRKESKTLEKASSVKVCRFGIQHLATAIIDSNGKLKVDVWKVTADGQISHLIDAPHNEDVNDIAINGIGGYDGAKSYTIATSFRDSQGKLKIITWRYFQDENKKHKLDKLIDETSWAIKKIVGNNIDLNTLVTVGSTPSGYLRVITWNISPDEDRSVTRRFTVTGEAAKEISCARVGIDVLATAIRDSSGNLKLTLWEVAADGYYIRKRSEASAGAIGKASICRGRQNMLATAVKDGSGDIKVICWKIE